jgi:TIR domain
MSSAVMMPPFSPDPKAQATVTRVLRGIGFDVDIGEPLIEIALSEHSRLIVGTHRDGGIRRIFFDVGDRVKGGDQLVEISGVPGVFRNAVFIAYRRSDSSGYTGRIYDGVARDIGSLQVFRDLGSLKPGRDFRDQVAEALQSARVMVVVIAPGWLTAEDHRGQRRLDDPDDLHRLEIRTALERGTAIVPVLVGGAGMPRRDQLPEDIQAFTRKQAIEISDSRWEYDAQKLTKTITELLDEEYWRLEQEARARGEDA